VILSANQLPERYQNCTWLHDTLADKRTIFRSLRTPLFFQSHIPSLADKRSELKQKILAELNRRSQSEIASLCQMTRSAQLPNSGERLAEEIKDGKHSLPDRLGQISRTRKSLMLQLQKGDSRRKA
jgi:hypothetical protein